MVLLVEDDRQTREMFEYALRIGGFDVSSVGDGLAALRLIDQHIIPDVIVLDLDLPQVSGVDFYEEMISHAETRNIPVVIVTGTSWQAPPGVFRTLRKPITSDMLVKVLERAIAQQEHHAATDSHYRSGKG